jgi:hypothetical protein
VSRVVDTRSQEPALILLGSNETFRDLLAGLLYGLFAAILISVWSHLGDVLGSDCEVTIFAVLLFCPNVLGSPSGSLRSRRRARHQEQCIGQV